MINGTNYSIAYYIVGEPYGDPEGVKVVNITANTELKAISVQVESNQNGTFRIDIPWTAIAALGLERNGDFIMLVDGEKIDHGIATEIEMLVLGGDFKKGTRQILIGDARIIPEFGSLTIAIAVIVMIAVILAGSHWSFLGQKNMHG